MKKFEFKMEKILNIKKKLEEQLKLDYSNANKHLIEEKGKLENLRNCYNGYQKHLTRILKSRINLLDVNYYKNALEYTEEKIINQTIIVDEAEKLLEDTRIKLLESIKERKTYEKLKEREYIKYLKEVEKEERKEIEEFIMFKYNKQIKEGD